MNIPTSTTLQHAYKNALNASCLHIQQGGSTLEDAAKDLSSVFGYDEDIIKMDLNYWAMKHNVVFPNKPLTTIGSLEV